jgi:hypothetical protein
MAASRLVPGVVQELHAMANTCSSPVLTPLGSVTLLTVSPDGSDTGVVANTYVVVSSSVPPEVSR